MHFPNIQVLKNNLHEFYIYPCLDLIIKEYAWEEEEKIKKKERKL